MINEQVMSIGDWSLTLRPDTPQSIREATAVDWSSGAPLGGAFSHIVITPAWVDVTNAGLSDAAILSAARYTGVVTRPGPQLTVGGVGLAWWLADADDNPNFFVWGAHSGATWSTAYTTAIGGRFTMGDIASGGSFTIPAQSIVSRRTRVDTIAQSAGHEWRLNADLTFDADTVANLYGTTPTVILIDGAAGRGGGLLGLEASFTVEEDWEQWASTVYIQTQAGLTIGSGTTNSAPSTYPIGGTPTKTIIVDTPDAPQGFEDVVADDLLARLNDPRFEVSVQVRDRALVEHVRCGDIVYVYDELQGLRDFDNQVEHNGRTVWPKVMRTTRMSWPVRQGMGVYWRTWRRNAVAPTYTDLTPYVAWEDGDASLDIIQGDAARYSLNPATGRVDTVGAAIERATAQPWATYTPSWGATGSAPTLSNGTLVGSYRRRGTELMIGGMLTYGSSSSAGTGGWSFSLPSGCIAVANRRQSVSGIARDVGSALAFSVAGDIAASGTTILFGSDRHSSTSGFYVGEAGTVPHTWATGDTLAWSGVIELAP